MRLNLDFSEQCDAACFDQFFAADGTGAFTGLRLQANLHRTNPENSGDSMANCVLVIRQLRSLGVYNAIEVDYPVTGFQYFGGSQLEHFGRIAAPVRFLRIGKHAANIRQCCPAQYSVGHGVQKHIGIAVTHKLPIMRDIHAAQTQRPAWRSAVRIFSKANPQF
jgi:hypothetical protein